jgi:ABC-type glycerol-3-phosphate transport system substrate-binding protein
MNPGKKLSRREMLKALGLSTAGVTLAACAAPPPAAPPTQAPAPDEEAAPVEAPPSAAKMTILHWAQAAEPTDPNTQLTEGQTPHVAYQNIADDYTEAHPDVEIEWYRFPAGAQFNEWFLARMTAQDCPDIYWANTENLWPHVNKGWVLDFTEYMNTANPYVADNAKWVDQFQEVAVISQTGPDGKLYGVNMDGAGVLTVYNKDAFADAGITAEPKTWNEFKDAWQKLLDKGYIPYGADLSSATCCFPHWFSAHAYNQLIWDDVYKWDDDKNRVITSKEVATHFQTGDFMDWDAYLKMAKLLKEMTPYFPVGYEGQLDYRQLFRQGKVAMYMEGNWAISEFTSSPPPFEISWLHFPIITKDIWPNSPEKIVRIQGAWGAMQYHVPGYLPDTAPEKIPAIMDWLMWSSKPEHVTAVCAETSLVPLTYGAQARPELAPFTAPYDRAVPYQSWGTLDGALGIEAEYTLWQAYLPSEMGDDEFLETAKKLLGEVVDKVLEANPDWKI